MKYLHIKGQSACLIIEKLARTDVPANVSARVAELSELNPGIKYYVYGGDDISHPIRMENASNMLSAFCNLRTVPSKPSVYNKIPKELNLKRPEMCDTVASTGYVQYHTFIDDEGYVEQMVGDDGNYYNIYKNVSHPSKIGGGELFMGYKTKFNSNSKDTTSIYDGETPINGTYNYEMLLRFFKDDYDNPLFVKLREFINEILGTDDFQKVYTFKQMANTIYDIRQSSPEINEKINVFVQSIKKDWSGVANSHNGKFIVSKEHSAQGYFPIWMYAIFHQGRLTSSSNTSIGVDNGGGHSATYIRLPRDVDHFRIPIDFDIIFKVDNPKFESALSNGRGVASILDGGVCEIVGMTDFEPEPDYESSWTKI